MEPQTYPTMRYHPTEAAVMCQTEEEVNALGAFWRPEPYTPEDIVKWRAAQAVAETPHPTPQDAPGTPPIPRGQAPRRPQSQPEDKDKSEE